MRHWVHAISCKINDVTFWGFEILRSKQSHIHTSKLKLHLQKNTIPIYRYSYNYGVSSAVSARKNSCGHQYGTMVRRSIAVSKTQIAVLLCLGCPPVLSLDQRCYIVGFEKDGIKGLVLPV